MKRILCLIAIVLLFRPTPAWDSEPQIKRAGIDQRPGQLVPLDLRFRDEEGREQPLSAYFGNRPVLLVPAYYSCTVLCSQLLGGLAGSLSGIALNAGTDFQVVAVSFDPMDTPVQANLKKAAVLRRYHRIGIDKEQKAAGWHFLVGDAPAIGKLMQALGYRYFYDEQGKQYVHPAGLAVLTSTGRITRYFLGLDYPPRELRLGLVEAAQGKIGTPFDHLLLLCYHYDPLRGKHGAFILRTLRVGGVLTILCLFTLIAHLARADGQRLLRKGLR
jgi:protein SCO1/2